MQIVVNCETRLCSQFLGPGDNFLQSYGAIFTDRAATGSGSLMDPMSTFEATDGFSCGQKGRRGLLARLREVWPPGACGAFLGFRRLFGMAGCYGWPQLGQGAT